MKEKTFHLMLAPSMYGMLSQKGIVFNPLLHLKHLE